MIYIKILVIFEYLFIVDIYFMYKKKINKIMLNYVGLFVGYNNVNYNFIILCI